MQVVPLPELYLALWQILAKPPMIKQWI